MNLNNVGKFRNITSNLYRLTIIILINIKYYSKKSLIKNNKEKKIVISILILFIFYFP